MTDQGWGRGPSKPNELSEQVPPNTLRTPGPRVAGRAPQVAPNALSGQPTSPTPPPSRTSPSGWTLPQRSPPARIARRSFSWWSLIVVAIFVLNIARAVLSSNGGLGFDTPTTAPIETPFEVVPEPTGTPEPYRLDPSLKPGIVEFGTSQGASCVLSGVATAFPVSARVRWWAHLGVSLPMTARVVWWVTRDNEVVTEEQGPGDAPVGSWDGLCGNAPIPNDGLGTYVLRVKDMENGVILSAGGFEIVGSVAPSAKP